MKTKITFKNFSTTAAFALLLLFSFNAKAQTYVYNETTSSGMFFQGSNGAQVSNPVSDAVNSSTNVARSATDGNWQQIQYFPTYTPVSGNKLYFSVYNPNNAGPGQVQFEYSSGGGWQFGGNPAYSSGSVTGWVEYSIDLAPHVGNEINKIIIMPAGNNASAVYIDNIYFASTSVLALMTSVVYDETTSSGIFFQGTNGAQVPNPVSGGINTSVTVAKSATDGNWQQIQYFPTYTPVSGNKLYFSVYNPNNAGPGQIQFEYTSGGGWQFGGNPAYSSGSVTGWVEYSIDLAPHVGNEINKIIIMPAGNNASAVYIDNIYFASASTLSSNSLETFTEKVFFDELGSVHFSKNQTNTKLKIFDIQGRLIMNETINGNKSEKSVDNKGIYILHIKSDSATGVKKLFFN